MRYLKYLTKQFLIFHSDEFWYIYIYTAAYIKYRQTYSGHGSLKSNRAGKDRHLFKFLKVFFTGVAGNRCIIKKRFSLELVDEACTNHRYYGLEGGRSKKTCK
jgi:hypothetical protein